MYFINTNSQLCFAIFNKMDLIPKYTILFTQRKAIFVPKDYFLHNIVVIILQIINYY